MLIKVSMVMDIQLIDWSKIWVVLRRVIKISNLRNLAPYANKGAMIRDVQSVDLSEIEISSRIQG